MPDDVKPRRRYHAPQRAEQAAATRRAVLDAARELFTTRGYPATTVAEVAR
ncbi:MAG TPA: TetR family transcriptional regulator, partial [Pseudonocardia sp.]|nr:TetR family transcriptional regulator [Pseudonocardia sp.]